MHKYQTPLPLQVTGLVGSEFLLDRHCTIYAHCLMSFQANGCCWLGSGRGLSYFSDGGSPKVTRVRTGKGGRERWTIPAKDTETWDVCPMVTGASSMVGCDEHDPACKCATYADPTLIQVVKGSLCHASYPCGITQKTWGWLGWPCIVARSYVNTDL